MKVEKFEDLVAWQKARELTKQIYEITKQGAFSKDVGYITKNQFHDATKLAEEVSRIS